MKRVIYSQQKDAHKGKRILFTLLLIFSSQFSYAQLNYSPLFTSGNFSKTIDLARPVGTVAGEAGVTPSGGSSYTIPIYAPPGTNGMKPSISISYNSQSAGGSAGYGWNIGGLSVITRTGKNLYYNNEVKPVEFTWNDAYLLDGTRLNPVLGNNSDNGTVYATESESFSKIFSWTGGGTLANPDWFEVIGKDGSVMQYGNSTDSRVLGEDGYSIMMWRLNRITDINGNYIEFRYLNTARDSRIDQINYTGNAAAGLAPYTTMKFNYGVRNETNTVYEAGASANVIYAINNIVITQLDDNGEPQIGFIKKYQFNYGFDNLHTMLKEVVESGTDNNGTAVLLNSTIFLYGDQPVNTSVAATPFIASNNSYYPGDFDADGKTDLLEVESYFNSDMNMRLDTKFTLLKDFQGSSGTLMYSKLLVQGPTQGTALDLDNKNFYNFLTGDYNKDGRDDILEANIAFSTPRQRRYLTNIVINFTGSHNPSTSLYDHTTQTYPVAQSDYIYIHPSGNFFIPGDFDGDGNQDFVTILAKWISGNQYDYKAWVSYPARNELNQPITGFGAGIPAFPSNTNERVAEAELITPIDMDGDGKMEIMVTHGGASYFYSLEKTTAFPGYPYWTQIYYSSTTEVISSSKVYPGDFNGDRKTDLLVKNSNDTWKTLISTGNTFVNYAFYFNQTVVMGGSVNHKILVSDYNGDGKSDILHGISTGNGGTSSTLSVYYSKGINAWLNEAYTYNNPIPSVQYVVVNSFTAGDFNGDGRTDIVNVVSPNTGAEIIYFKPDGKERLLSKVTDGHNSTTSFSYKPLTDKSTFPYVYERTVSLDDPSNQNPFNYVQLPMQVVSAMTVPDGIGGTNTTSFYYEDAMIHRYAKGFLGFKKVTAVNPVMGVKTIAENAINTQWAIPYSVKQTSVRYADNSIISESFATNSFVNLSTGSHDIRYFQKVDKTLEVDYLNGKAAENENTYDSYGNVTVNVAKVGILSGVIVAPVETTTTTAIYGYHNTPFPAKPDEVTVSNTRTGMPAISVTSTYTYASNGNPSTKTSFTGLPKAVTTAYTYNSFGNVLQTTTSASGVSNRLETATYDARGRYPLTKQMTDGTVNQTETFTYDGKWGKPLSQKSINCNTTTFEYDVFGRVKTAYMPEGYAVNTSLNWDVQGEQLFYTFTDFPGGKPDSKTWVDKLGREIKKQVKGFNGDWLTQLTTYNARGLVITKTNNYYPLETPVLTTTLYDDYNRPYRVENPLTVINYAYNPLSGGRMQLITQNGISGQFSSKIADAAGRVVTALDDGGQLDYTYDSQGSQVEVKHGNTTMVTSVYDVYGRQTSLTDKNAGTINYDYDAYGQLISQTDALSNTYIMTYDGFGRMITRSGTEGTTTYEYNTGVSLNKCKGHQLKKVTGFNGVIQEYTYDGLRRLQTEKNTVDGTDFITSYAYDSYSNPSSTAYPSGVVVNNVYDNSGSLIAVNGGDSWNPVNLFTANAENGYGQLTSYTLGNGKTSQNTYQYGIPTRLYTQGVQDLNLSFDYTRGNLLSRYDAMKNLTESFQYDNLDRLTTSTVNGVQQMSINFDGSSTFSRGNITSKTDAGNYVYRNDKVHAVAYIINPAGPAAPPITISPTQQQITYTPFLKTASITEGSVQTNFTYGPDYQRIKTEMLVSGNINTTKYFLGGFERIINGSTVRDIHYIPVGNSIAIIEKYLYSSSTIHFVYTDYLGSLLTRTDISGNITSEQNFDAWGRPRNPNDWQYAGAAITPSFFDRGYTGHEMLPYHYLINMNGRMYDPIQGRMLSPDNYVPDPWHTQGYNRYSYANNNPLKFTDPDGNNPLLVIAIAAAIFGTGNTVAHAIRGDINSIWDGFRYFAQGALAGAAVATGVAFGLGIPIISTAVKVAAVAYAGSAALSVASGFGRGVFTGDWSGLENAGRTFLGNFYLDENRSFFGGIWQGVSRFSWELPQSTLGHTVSQLRNTFGGVNRVDYFGGATFSTRTNTDGRQGISIGNHINVSITDEIQGGFDERVQNDPLYMHEYGHTFQSQSFGLFYIPIPGLLSFFSGANSVPGDPGNLTTHDFRWYERGANRLAARYFGRHFGVNWALYEPPNGTFPRNRR